MRLAPILAAVLAAGCSDESAQDAAAAPAQGAVAVSERTVISVEGRRDSAAAGTLAVGRFERQGNALSSQYAPHLAGLRERIGTRIAELGAWRVMETRQVDELVGEQLFRQLLQRREAEARQAAAGPPPLLERDIRLRHEAEAEGRVDAVERSKLPAKVSSGGSSPAGRDGGSVSVSGGGSSRTELTVRERYRDPEQGLPKVDLPDLPGADLLLAGAIEGFDLVMAPRPHGGGAERALAGRTWRATARVSLRVVDTRSREWVAAKSVRFSRDYPDGGSVEQLMDVVTGDIAERLVAEALLAASGDGRVVHVGAGGQSLGINRGRRHGLREGMTLAVYGKASERVDPETGALLRFPGAHLGRATVTVVDERSATLRFEGVGTPEYDGMVVLRDREGEADAAGLLTADPVSVALGGIRMPHLEASMPGHPPDRERLRHLAGEGIVTALRGIGGLTVAEQASERVEALLAQQLTTDMAKGGAPGLPLGTIQGVDYLVWGEIVSVVYRPPGSSVEKVALTGESITHARPGSLSLEGFLHIQDVHSAALPAAVAVRAERTIGSADELADRESALAQLFTAEAVPRLAMALQPPQVLSVQQGGAVLNHGLAAGLTPGMVLELLGATQQVADPATGTPLTIAGPAIGRLRVVSYADDRGRYAVAEPIGNTRPQAGDRLRVAETQGMEPGAAGAAPMTEADRASAQPTKPKKLNW